MTSVITPLILGVFCWFLMSLIKNPENWKVFPPKRYYDEENGAGAWFLSSYVWASLEILIYFYGSTVFLYNGKLFVDRYCINQSDTTLNAMGLLRLQDVLARSAKWLNPF